METYDAKVGTPDRQLVLILLSVIASVTETEPDDLMARIYPEKL